MPDCDRWRCWDRYDRPFWPPYGPYERDRWWSPYGPYGDRWGPYGPYWR